MKTFLEEMDRPAFTIAPALPPEPVVPGDAVNLDAQIRVLKARKAQLEEIQRLRQEVGTLEQAVMVGQEESTRRLRLITQVVAEHFGVTTGDLVGKRQLWSVAQPRMVVFLLATEFTSLTRQAIGIPFGGKDHSTITHGCRRITDLMETNPSLRASVEQVRVQVKALIEAKPSDKN